MKLIMTFICCFITLNFHAQATKKQGYLFDETGNTISQELFDAKIKSQKYIWLISENKDSINARLLPRQEYGKITSEKRDELISALQELTGLPISAYQSIIINYFQKEKPLLRQRPNIDYYTSDRVYRRFIKKNKTVFQAFVTEKGFGYEKDFVYEDKNEIIKKLLFKQSADCGYIIIKPNGNYFKMNSEYRQDYIPSKLKENW